MAANPTRSGRLVPYTDEEPSDEPSRSIDGLSDNDSTRDDDEQAVPLIAAAGPASKRNAFQRAVPIIIASFCFIALVAALTIFFAVKSSGSAGTSQRPGSSSPTQNQNHKTQQKQQSAVAYKLNLPALYPDITSEPNSECHTAWAAFTAVPCHDKLFDRSSDNSTWKTLGWDPMYFLPRLCKANCKTALKEAYSQLAAKCSSDDTFILDGYKGMFNPTWLEPGPAAAVNMLVHRTDHLCRSAPYGDSDYEFCPVEMLERFAIIDGINVNLKAIDTFVSDTNNRRIEPARWMNGRKGTNKYSYRYHYKVRTQNYGPNTGETSCGWCTFDFLNRTLNSWSEGAVLSPDSMQPVSLPEFIRRVRLAGERCAPTSKWDKMYKEAIVRYSSAGALPTDWEQTLPSGDVGYLIKHGPSLGDSPISDIFAERERIMTSEFRDSWNGSDLTLATTAVCLTQLGEHYTSAKCYINLPHDVLVKMVENEEKSKNLREAYCSQECSDALNTWQDTSCLANEIMAEEYRFFEEYSQAKRQRALYCDLLGQNSYKWNCAKGLLSMNMTSWAFTGRPETPIFIAKLEEALEELKKRLAPEGQKEGSSRGSTAAGRKAERKKQRELGNSVCAGCIWNWLTGKDMNEAMEYISGASSASEYVDFVKNYHTTCTSLGANWLGGEPYGDDPVIWRVKDEQGKIVRYIQAPKGGFHGEAVYGVNEATGGVFFYEKNRNVRPGVDVGSVWNVLQAERGFKATEEGRFDEWKLEEEEHRKEVDKEIWEVDRWGDVRYVGPDHGF